MPRGVPVPVKGRRNRLDARLGGLRAEQRPAARVRSTCQVRREDGRAQTGRLPARSSPRVNWISAGRAAASSLAHSTTPLSEPSAGIEMDSPATSGSSATQWRHRAPGTSDGDRPLRPAMSSPTIRDRSTSVSCSASPPPGGSSPGMSLTSRPTPRNGFTRSWHRRAGLTRGRAHARDGRGGPSSPAADGVPTPFHGRSVLVGASSARPGERMPYSGAHRTSWPFLSSPRDAGGAS